MADTATVTKLPTADDRSGKVYNFELTFNLGKTGQGRLLTDFPQSISEDDLTRRMDMLERQMRRQQAKYLLDEAEEELELREAQVAQWRQDHGDAEKDHRKKKAELEQRIKALTVARDEGEQRAKQAWAGAGKRGEFKPDNQTRQAMTAAERKVAEGEDELTKLDAERKQAQDTLDVNLRGAEKLIGKLRSKIEKLMAVISRPANER